MSNEPFVPNTLSHKQKQSRLCVTIDDKVCISINDCDDYGTVRFIGILDGKGLNYYYGIELPLANGKNDGKHNKIEYFRCGPKKGIFVKRFRIHFVEYPNIRGPRISIGDIVKIGSKYKCKGTVKYIGIPSFKRILQKGNWYGIELNKKIGINNGIINGIKYFDTKDNYGILITSKHISVIENNHNQINDSDEKIEHGIMIKQVSSEQLTRERSKSKKRDSINKKKMHKMTESNESNNSNASKSSKHSKNNDKILDEENKDSEEYKADNIWIINEYGYSISFLLSDKRPNILILKEQIMNLFGHIELLENQQIYIKNVDKMCLLVRVTFHKLKSYEKAVKWKFCWKNKTVSMKKHGFKQYKKQIDVKEIFPINFEYKKELNLKEEYVRKYLIEYLSNLEDLSQYEWQIKFSNNNENENENIKCIINFVNEKAREKLFNSKFIELNGDKNNRCKLCIDVDLIKK